MSVRKVLPVIMLSSIMIASGFIIHSAYADPPEKYKIRFNTDEPIVIDGQSLDPVLIEFHGETKNVDEGSSVSVTCAIRLFDSSGVQVRGARCPDFPQSYDPNTKFQEIVDIGSQSYWANEMDTYSAVIMIVEARMFVDFGEQDSDVVSIVK